MAPRGSARCSKNPAACRHLDTLLRRHAEHIGRDGAASQKTISASPSSRDSATMLSQLSTARLPCGGIPLGTAHSCLSFLCRWQFLSLHGVVVRQNLKPRAILTAREDPRHDNGFVQQVLITEHRPGLFENRAEGSTHKLRHEGPRRPTWITYDASMP
jgi:hypothetical protein